MLESCGFQVIYKEDLSSSSITQDLAAIRIQKNRTKLDQQIKNNIYDAINPDAISVEPKYFLILTTSKTISSAITTSTGASGRNKIILRIDYQLKDLKTLEVLSSGFVIANDNYDVTINRYGTYSADEYVSSNLTTVVAQKIRNALVSDLLSAQKKEVKK